MPYYQITEIHIGPLVLQVWGIFVALGFFVATLLARRFVQKRELSEDVLLSLALVIFIGGLLGARIEYVLLFWNEQFSSNINEVWRFWDGGMISFGGFFGGALTGLMYLWYREVSRAAYFDVLAFVFPLGYAIGRVGCHLVKDHLGSITNVPWGVVVAPGEVRHETALYSILAGIVIFVTAYIFRNKLRRPWYMTLYVIFFYGLTRSIIDIFRATDLPFSDPRYGGLTAGQYLSFASMMFVVAVYIGMQRKKPMNNKPIV